ncbi:Upf3p NDAI_0B02610 [Naumovozyma dairenensis CBS 421]|uniref:UPF3 domain-containing protein n=1 Tax=Naumovozyma dairenensis (strain ATCC 10597 / BCRC 20456 / CBS 421 / NBRC 0211 / NRRL Y-12639) TaxID=1071378 RepID=G0W685_NAUDC|nr:hypothetical protein NDAI_0B02610 [Naumovozyma dairenensis CBS 421]CCD23296.1 hypothetical protein NDAI_0B02610 [Naumovozyma dairenensis CBS 421]
MSESPNAQSKKVQQPSPRQQQPTGTTVAAGNTSTDGTAINPRNRRRRPKSRNKQTIDTVPDKEANSTAKSENATHLKGSNKPAKKRATQQQQKQQKRQKQRQKQDRNESNLFKLVLRHLPPNLNSENFIKNVSLSKNIHDLYLEWYYIQGHYSSKLFKQPHYSRAYFIFDSIVKLNKFASIVKNMKFIDDHENVMIPLLTLSSYIKSIEENVPERSRNNPKKHQRTKAPKKDILEGTIENDDLFKMFLGRSKENDKVIDYGNFSLLRPVRKEVSRQKEADIAAAKKSELALTKLAGGSASSTKDVTSQAKNANKDKNKDKISKENKKEKQKGAKATTGTTEGKKKSRRSKKKKKNVPATNTNMGSGNLTFESSTDNATNKKPTQNVVILEAAGKKELQKRKKQISKTSNVMPSLLSQTNNNHIDSPTKNIQSSIKILKREK